MNASGRVEKGDIGQIELLTKNRAYNTLSLWNTLFHWQSIDCYNLLVLVQKARICCMSSKLCICHTTIFHWWSSGWYHYFFVLVKARIGCKGLHICRWILCSLWHGQASLEDLGLASHSRKVFWNVLFLDWNSLSYSLEVQQKTICSGLELLLKTGHWV